MAGHMNESARNTQHVAMPVWHNHLKVVARPKSWTMCSTAGALALDRPGLRCLSLEESPSPRRGDVTEWPVPRAPISGIDCRNARGQPALFSLWAREP